MEKKEGPFYKIYWFWNIVKHGLFWHGVRNRLARLGLDFMPYYWVQEDVSEYKTPQIRDKSINYSISFLTEEDLLKIKKNIIGIEHKNLLDYYEQGQLCIGLKTSTEIAAYMFIQSKNVLFRGKKMILKENEAYLHSMYTFEAYRGKNLAPYLRYKSYEILNEKGIYNKYSVSEYFNKSTIRFKSKLGSKHVRLHLSVILFNKLKTNFILQKFSN